MILMLASDESPAPQGVTGRRENATGIARRYLHDEVAERMRELIVSGELGPKTRVNELELAQRFGISRTPLREAIKILATEGLLELLPNRGARIATISLTEIDEVIEVIAGLEGTAAELACQRMSEAEIDVIATHTTAMVAALEAGDQAAYFLRNQQIHDALMQASRNQTLQGIYANLHGRIQRARYSADKSPEQWRLAIEEHVKMVELLRGRKADRLGALMRKHLRSKKAIIAAAFGEANATGETLSAPESDVSAA
jgi:DNA-binding GntR family transcriptional regulator